MRFTLALYMLNITPPMQRYAILYNLQPRQERYLLGQRRQPLVAVALSLQPLATASPRKKPRLTNPASRAAL